jgi:Fe-S oxidoreductase
MCEKSEFDRHTREVQARFRARGVREIISIVPSCTYTLRVLMREAGDGQDLKVRHFCEILAERIADLSLRFPQQVKITYHDPCQLVRYLGLVEEPRKILRAIKNIEMVEPVWTCGEWATCCGGGGGFEAVFPEISEMLAKNRVKELLETGASIIVTHCPGCIMQLEAGLRALKIKNVRVCDLASMVAMSLEGESADVRV